MAIARACRDETSRGFDKSAYLSKFEMSDVWAPNQTRATSHSPSAPRSSMSTSLDTTSALARCVLCVSCRVVSW
jgi:hypothetical protein